MAVIEEQGERTREEKREKERKIGTEEKRKRKRKNEEGRGEADVYKKSGWYCTECGGRCDQKDLVPEQKYDGGGTDL